ncbi:MAG: M3 family metallopeptidase [Bacteroidetes bacterium]|nr:M3 family metallopeptidase [Bacteroidota bacterium]
MKKKILMMMCAGIGLVSCGGNEQKENPLLQEFNTPFQTPPFNEIELTNFKPAFEKAISENTKEINAIVSTKEAPTFENTIVALNNSGKMLDRIERVFSTLKANMSNDELMDISKEITPILTSHYDNISMNDELFGRIKTVYDNRNDLNLDALSIRTIEKYYNSYKRKGAGLNSEQKEELKKLNSKLAMLSLTFGENLLKDTKAYKLIIENEEDLEGLPESVCKSSAEDAKSADLDGKWLFTVDKPSMLPFLQYSSKRELRKDIYNAYYNRGINDNNNNNTQAVNEIINLNIRKANLLGFNSYASYLIDNNMAKTPEKVYELMLELWRPALKQAKKELIDLQKLASKDNVTIEAWDWWYYAEKLRSEKYNFDEEEMRPYLSVDNVRDGMFYVANKLYGITLERRSDIQTYHEDVETYEVKESDGSHLGILYLDYFPRESKEGGAWCEEIRPYDWNGEDEIFPLVTITGNFSKPVGDKPALLSFDDTETMFHEFGHALHSLFSRGKYSKVCGTIPLDMVELPSQVMENWASEPEVMKVYALNYKTGEVMPDDMIAKIGEITKFNQGWATTEHVAAALLDMDWYTREKAEENIDVLAFEKSCMEKYGLIKEINPRYRTTFFKHIFCDGYSAGYYVYTWAALLDSDAFSAFKESGDIFNPEIAKKFRKNVLSEGGYDEGMVQYLKFRGEEPSVKPLMRKRGFIK